MFVTSAPRPQRHLHVTVLPLSRSRRARTLLRRRPSRTEPSRRPADRWKGFIAWTLTSDVFLSVNLGLFQSLTQFMFHRNKWGLMTVSWCSSNLLQVCLDSLFLFQLDYSQQFHVSPSAFVFGWIYWCFLMSSVCVSVCICLCMYMFAVTKLMISRGFNLTENTDPDLPKTPQKVHVPMWNISIMTPKSIAEGDPSENWRAVMSCVGMRKQNHFSRFNGLARSAACSRTLPASHTCSVLRTLSQMKRNRWNICQIHRFMFC